MNSLSKVFEKSRQLKHTDLGVKSSSRTQDIADAHEGKICEFLREEEIYARPAKDLSEREIDLIEKGWFDILTGKMFPGNWYIHQPCNTQRAIDILIQYNGKLFLLECKTGKTIISFNGTLPKEGVIYIFTEAESNSTTFFMGDELGPEVREALLKSRDDLREFARERSKEIVKMPENTLGFMLYGRGKFEQRGEGEVTRFCTRPDREDLEQRVLDFVEAVSGDRDLELRRYRSTEEYFIGDFIELKDGRKGIVSDVKWLRFDIMLDGDKEPTTLQHKKPVNPDIKNVINFSNIA